MIANPTEDPIAHIDMMKAMKLTRAAVAIACCALSSHASESAPPRIAAYTAMLNAGITTPAANTTRSIFVP